MVRATWYRNRELLWSFLLCDRRGYSEQSRSVAIVFTTLFHVALVDAIHRVLATELYPPLVSTVRTSTMGRQTSIQMAQSGLSKQTIF